jgi:hypothetical protein
MFDPGDLCRRHSKALESTPSFNEISGDNFEQLGSGNCGDTGMAKNDAILLEGILNDRMNSEAMALGEVFELFAFEQILKSFDLTREELESGWVDGKDDGGIDGFFTFVNGVLVDDATKFPWPKKSVSIDVFIISCKHHDTFRQEPLNTVFPTIEELLDFGKNPSDFEGMYSVEVLKARDITVQAFRKTAGALPKLNFHLVYATRGDVVELNIEARGNQLKRFVADYFSDAKVEIEFVGATKLIEIHRKSRFLLELPFSEQLSGEQGAYVLLVRLRDYARFVSDESGNLRRYLFDSNVRDFLGENRVNQDIFTTLVDGYFPDFWWLNNGVTILATSAIPLGKTANGNALQLHDVQIVNGLQTTHAIHSFEHNAPDNRSVLVKVIVSDDTAVRDKIIRATNNQTSVELASLTATDKIQRDIEQILEGHNWFYERRKNYYKNIGKPVERFVQPLYVGVANLALVRKAPHVAGRLQPRFMQDSESYAAVFSPSLPILIWPILVSILKAVDSVIFSNLQKGHRIESRILANWRGAVALCAVAEVLKTFEYSIQDLLAFDVNSIREERVSEIFEFLIKNASPVAEGKAKVQLACERFAEVNKIPGAEVVGRWQLPKKSKFPIPDSSSFLKIESGVVVKLAPQMPSAEEMEKIFNALPAQPWKSGMQKSIAVQLGLDKKIVTAAVKMLIEQKRCLQQIDGVAFDDEGVVRAIDTDRFVQTYRVGDTLPSDSPWRRRLKSTSNPAST